MLNLAEIYILPNKNRWNRPDESRRSNGIVHRNRYIDDRNRGRQKGRKGARENYNAYTYSFP